MLIFSSAHSVSLFLCINDADFYTPFYYAHPLHKVYANSLK
ncbi:hypothetical protein JCM19237_4545 [Photobacterium aphoticum]|uniref:Uncharacterized protein n=1 Tax=Photobacterium aphoticum TaxID=754436 RepID=A0A090QZ35_9GAMM|nr:hypothetical protein JCM19237_4545 [Photobacterium aphoticum]